MIDICLHTASKWTLSKWGHYSTHFERAKLILTRLKRLSVLKTAHEMRVFAKFFRSL